MSFHTISDLNEVISIRTFSQKERSINEGKEYVFYDIFLYYSISIT